MKTTVSIIKALSDENRLRAFFALCKHRLCVCQIVELLQLAPSTVSKHLSILQQAGLIVSEKEGRWVYYRVDPNASCCEAGSATKWVCDSLGNDPQVMKDEKTIQRILKMDPEVLCKNLLKK